MGDIEKYGIYGRRCRVCGETTGIPESDTCFDHRNAPMGASPGPWRWAKRPEWGETEYPVDADGKSVSLSPGADANRQLLILAPDMASMLQSLEWAGICEGRRNQCCACLNFQDEGHTPDCRLSSLLAELPK